jgi:hypothetical protein
MFLRSLNVVDGEIKLPIWRDAFRYTGTFTRHHSAGVERLVGTESLIDTHGSHFVPIIFLPAVMPRVVSEGFGRIIGKHLVPAHVAGSH